ncbi:multiheme c-type cytochrome [Ferruginibacter sp. HRS2-29]|uniref:multiheme c-type cytochrome n=1 Tax=Ferruginibacter sp. HRS2-29 TaxID=2487334 RepID=UPI0020CC6A91|nr:multiheme c-type cytochrome [Ferruginibacter sp. HRS2-29]
MRKSLVLILSLFVAVFIFSKCINNAKASTDPRGNIYAGAASCRQCHQAVYDSFIGTGHFNSTAAAGKKNIHGSFENGHNEFHYTDGSMVKMEASDSGFYQAEYKDGKKLGAYRFDIIFGGKNAQTYAYLANKRMYELPVSHYNSINGWATSPGYLGNTPFFKRPLIAGCFECHTSYIRTNTNMTPNEISEEYVEGTLIHGIDCERCHGPAQNHVNYHEAYPEEKNAKYILKNLSLSRQQKTDACAVCHSGNDRVMMASRFNFKMGDTLENMYIPFANAKKGEPDVHGNQFGLLSKSRCYLQSSTMTCNTCHSPHSDAVKSPAIYSQKCLACHSEATHNFCPKAATMGESIKNNCIDCHMPLQPSGAIMYQVAGKEDMTAYMLRNHRIAVYGTPDK